MVNTNNNFILFLYIKKIDTSIFLKKVFVFI